MSYYRPVAHMVDDTWVVRDGPTSGDMVAHAFGENFGVVDHMRPMYWVDWYGGGAGYHSGDDLVAVERQDEARIIEAAQVLHGEFPTLTFERCQFIAAQMLGLTAQRSEAER